MNIWKSTFTVSQAFDVEALGETGLSLIDSISVACGVGEDDAKKMSLDPEIRKAHARGRTKGVSLVMQGLSDAARKGSASAAATLLKAGAIALEQEQKIEYEIMVGHKSQKPVDHSKAVKAAMERQRELHRQPMEARSYRMGRDGQ